jgi:hypothetical protein
MPMAGAPKSPAKIAATTVNPVKINDGTPPMAAANNPPPKAAINNVKSISFLLLIIFSLS